MNTTDVQTAANSGNIATGDFLIGTVLRRKVVPRFLEDVGRIGWRRRSVELTLDPGDRQKDLPADFFEVSSVSPELTFIGEDDGKVAQAELNTSLGAPSQYWLVPGSTAGVTAMRFDVPASATLKVRVFYFYQIPFANDASVVDFGSWIPAQYHWALVEALKLEIFLDRFGQADPRYATQKSEYAWWINQIAPKREMARRNKAIIIG